MGVWAMRRYRRFKLVAVGGVAVALLSTGGATADPRIPFLPPAPDLAEPIQWANPAAKAAGTGVTPQVTRIPLGSFERPADGVAAQAGVPSGVPEGTGAARRPARSPSPASPRRRSAPSASRGGRPVGSAPSPSLCVTMSSGVRGAPGAASTPGRRTATPPRPCHAARRCRAGLDRQGRRRAAGRHHHRRAGAARHRRGPHRPHRRAR